MPVLPSGRRIEFSLDRFHALLGQMDNSQAQHIAETLSDPDDLLYVLDAVHFSLEDGSPFFADYVAANWKSYAADWCAADKQALQGWLVSEDARCYRAEAVAYIKSLLSGSHDSPVSYPYRVAGDVLFSETHQGSLLRQ